MRGKLRQARVPERGRRLIPARAGKTLDIPHAAPRHRAHPRACGENPQVRREVFLGGGSSPRVRGKHQRRRGLLRLMGLIPARAGKTPPAPASPPSRPAHPRACGENRLTFSAASRSSGSSPRVRGKLVGGRGLPDPALAHPRACGENSLLSFLSLLGLGSSPRVRGKQEVGIGQGVDGRLIPARAGKTRPRRG